MFVKSATAIGILMFSFWSHADVAGDIQSVVGNYGGYGSYMDSNGTANGTHSYTAPANGKIKFDGQILTITMDRRGYSFTVDAKGIVWRGNQNLGYITSFGYYDVGPNNWYSTQFGYYAGGQIRYVYHNKDSNGLETNDSIILSKSAN